MQDGARNAFTGYLYQFVGVASLRARAITVSDLEAELAFDLVASVDNGQLVHELHGQDAVIRAQPGGNGECVAIQFKYARTHDRMKIERSELIGILHAFDRSFREAKAHGDSLDRFVLVTNRTFDWATKALYDQRGHAQVPRALIARKDSERAKTVTTEYGSAHAAAAAWHKVLKNLSIWTELRYEAAVKQLQVLAMRHGLFPEEFDEACGRIVSSMIEATVRGPLEITSEWLTRCFVKAPDARVLHVSSPDPTTRSAAAAALQRNITTFVRDGGSLVRRRLIDEASGKLRQFPVVWLTGDGGCGKSVLGLQLLIQEADGRLALFLPGRSATRDTCLAEALWPIRSEQHHHLLPRDPVPMFLNRVCVANADMLPPFIIVDVDGLDEVPESERHGLRQLIELFFSRGRNEVANAVLVLTCRAPERDRNRAVEGLVSNWFDSELPDIIADQIGAVHVGDFDDDELREAARILADDVGRRIDEMLPRSLASDRVSTGAESSGSGGATPLELELLDSLRHPAMWGVFAAIPSADRISALSGDVAALAAMADKFLDRFCRKTSKRRTTLRRDQLRDGLSAISRVPSQDRVVRDRQADWVQPALGPLNLDEAAFLYGEGLSYGLTREEAPGKWRWRHGFVRDYLCRGG